MAVLRELPWYQEIEQRGIRIGEERGRRMGEELGRRENFISNIATILEVKFGSEGLELMPQIVQISDLERLQEILRSIVVANTIEELQEIV